MEAEAAKRLRGDPRRGPQGPQMGRGIRGRGGK